MHLHIERTEKHQQYFSSHAVLSAVLRPVTFEDFLCMKIACLLVGVSTASLCTITLPHVTRHPRHWSALLGLRCTLLPMHLNCHECLQASTPAIIYLAGVCLHNEHLQLVRMLKVLVVCSGVAMASYGDITVTLVGVMLQLCGVIADALRICFLQKV